MGVVVKTHERSSLKFFMGRKEERKKFSSSAWITWPAKAGYRTLRKSKVVLLFAGLTIALLMSI